MRRISSRCAAVIGRARRLRAVRMHDIEAVEAGLEISEGAAVVGGGDLAPQVRHQHHLVAGLARLRDQVIGGLAGDEHDLDSSQDPAPARRSAPPSPRRP